MVTMTCNIDFIGFVKTVTENGWILNFKFRKVVQRHIYGVLGNVAWFLFQSSRRIQQ